MIKKQINQTKYSVEEETRQMKLECRDKEAKFQYKLNQLRNVTTATNKVI